MRSIQLLQKKLFKKTDGVWMLILWRHNFFIELYVNGNVTFMFWRGVAIFYLITTLTFLWTLFSLFFQYSNSNIGLFSINHWKVLSWFCFNLGISFCFFLNLFFNSNGFPLNCDNFMGNNKEQKPWTNVQNTKTRLKGLIG